MAAKCPRLQMVRVAPAPHRPGTGIVRRGPRARDGSPRVGSAASVRRRAPTRPVHGASRPATRHTRSAAPFPRKRTWRRPSPPRPPGPNRSRPLRTAASPRPHGRSPDTGRRSCPGSDPQPATAPPPRGGHPRGAVREWPRHAVRPSGASIDGCDDANGSLRALRVPSVVWTRSGGNRRRGVERCRRCLRNPVKNKSASIAALMKKSGAGPACDRHA